MKACYIGTEKNMSSILGLEVYLVVRMAMMVVGSGGSDQQGSREVQMANLEYMMDSRDRCSLNLVLGHSLELLVRV